MPIVDGKYVNPGYVNDTSPALNATEVNAIANTLEMVPTGNGGTGTDTPELIDDGSVALQEWTFYKWGKLVMASYKSTSKFSEADYELPEELKPIAPVYFTAPGVAATSASLQTLRWAYNVTITKSGMVYIRPTYDTGEGAPPPYYVRFTVCWLID